jgi:methyl-accepting chemotaxis protein
LSERQVPLTETTGYSTQPRLSGNGARSKETLFIATFPNWNWVTVIGVEGELLSDTLRPMRQSTIEIVVTLVTSSAILVGLCGYAAWRFARSINRQLLQLATAADSIAGGDRGLQLDYPADDALGKLVRAFNAMAKAVSDREDSLRAQIHVLEINISEQALQGQVCSITDSPGFNRLSDRARAMRERRQRLEKKAAEE